MYEVLTIATPPTTTPVSLALSKKQCRVDVSDTTEDDLINVYLQAATTMVSAYLKRTLVNTTYTLTRDYLLSSVYSSPTGNLAYNVFLNTSVYPMDNVITLMKPPIVSVTSITYKDMAGQTQTLSPSLYYLEPGTPGRLSPAYGKVFPFSLPQIGSITITYVAGYGFLQDGVTPNVPFNIQAAILLCVGTWYANRESVVVGTNSGVLPLGVKELLDSASPGFYR